MLSRTRMLLMAGLFNKLSTNPSLVTASVFSIPADAANGVLSAALQGNSANSIIVNGGFADGTGWTAVRSTNSVSNGILTNTGDGSNNEPYVRTVANLSAGKKYINARVRVTNATCTSINLYCNPSYIHTINTPVQNQWYDVSVVATIAATTLYFTHTYATAAGANGQVLEIQKVMAIDMGTSASDSPYYNLIASEMATRFPSWLSYGTKSTFKDGGRIKSVGKNLFDKSKTTPNKYVAVDGTLANGGTTCASDYTSVLPNTQYKRSHSEGTAFYNSQKNVISWTPNESFTTPANAAYVRMTVTNTTIDAFQLEKGNTATAYEPYTETKAIIPSSTIGLTSLPNGTKDELILSGVDAGVKVQRNKGSKVITGADIDSLYTGFTNVDMVVVQSTITDIKTTSPDTESLKGMVTIDGKKELTVSERDVIANIGNFYHINSNGMVQIIVTKNAFVDLAAAKAYFDIPANQVTLNYQLATPITSIVPVTITDQDNNPVQSLKSFGANTTVIAELDKGYKYLQAGDVTSFNDLTYANNEYIMIVKTTIPNSVEWTNAVEGKVFISGYTEVANVESSFNGIAITAFATSSTFLAIIVPKGTWGSLAAAQAALTGKLLTYDLIAGQSTLPTVRHTYPIGHPRNELVYNPNTWAEWTKDAGVIGDSTGLEFTALNGSWITAYLSLNLKVSTKYGYLIHVVSNTIPSGAGNFFLDNSLLPQTNVWQLSGVVGNQKFVDTTKSSITNNRIKFVANQALTTGQKIKLKDIRAYELPTGSQIEFDFNNLTADQLAAKYPY